MKEQLIYLRSKIKNRTQIMTSGHSQMNLIHLIFQKDQADQGNPRHLRSISKPKVCERKRIWLGTAVAILLFTACTMGSHEPTGSQAPEDKAEIAAKYDEYNIVTLLPRDAIPAIDNPEFYSPTEADEFYSPDELVIGVEFNGDARAYSVPFLSGHEIVNDTVGGEKIAVTW